jgi:hypothetical protein
MVSSIPEGEYEGYLGSVQYRFVGPDDARHSFRIVVVDRGRPAHILNESVACRSLDQGSILPFKWSGLVKSISLVDDTTNKAATPGLYHVFIVT